MPLSKPRKPGRLERDWDPAHSVVVHNKTNHNILLNLPTGYFRLDAGRSIRMTSNIADVPQVEELVKAGQVEIGNR